MKKILLFCLFGFAYIIYPKNASAQYKSVFGDSSTSWSLIMTECVDNFSSDNYYYTKDTLINETLYKALSYGSLSHIFLREDTVEGKLWCFDEYSIKREYLVMDMSLQKGDSFPFYSIEMGETYIWPVDSVYYEGGNKIILFKSYVNCSYRERLRFIEGTGPTSGFINNGDEYSNGGYMLCHFKDGKQVFSSKKYKQKCSVNTLIGIEDLSHSEINAKLYPNPTNGAGIITFENSDNACINLEIYDLNGKRIFQNSSKNTYITFDINAFENGIYIYKLINGKGEFSSGRIIKQ